MFPSHDRSRRFFDLEALIKIVAQTDMNVERIEKSYTVMGLDDDRLIMELEAFLVAEFSSAERIASVVNTVCESK